MKNTPTATLVSALRVLSVDVQSEDGVANAVLAEAADRMTLLAQMAASHLQETQEDTTQMHQASEAMAAAAAKIAEMRERIKRLEEAGDQLLRDNQDMANINRWWRAKEAKP